jgi:hypothetical protein
MECVLWAGRAVGGDRVAGARKKLPAEVTLGEDYCDLYVTCLNFCLWTLRRLVLISY